MVPPLTALAQASEVRTPVHSPEETFTVDIVVTGRHVAVSDRFRTHVEDKLAKVSQLAPRTRRIEVKISHEPNRRQSKACDRVEITCVARGPVVRAEACADDKYAALDMVIDKLTERLRRAGDKRQVHRGRRTPQSVGAAMAAVAPPWVVDSDTPATEDSGAFGDSPIEVREKVHRTSPMSLADALSEMELVGHDFFLFHDKDTDKVSVLYRRHGWSYGVLHLEVDADTERLDDAAAAS